MRFTTLALAAAGVSSALAAPPTKYTWQITKWSFCRGEGEYDYAFTISGARNGGTPAFKAICAGSSPGKYAACNTTQKDPNVPVPEVSAKVKIVTDPKNPNDNIPKLFVTTTYTDDNSCRYMSEGSQFATLNCGSSKGSKFKITPTNEAVC